jgi:hypothetical protein
VILLNAIVEIVIATMSHLRSQDLTDGTWVGIMPIGRHPFWSVTDDVASLLEKALGGLQISLLAQPGVNQIPIPIDGLYCFPSSTPWFPSPRNQASGRYATSTHERIGIRWRRCIKRKMKDQAAGISKRLRQGERASCWKRAAGGRTTNDSWCGEEPSRWESSALRPTSLLDEDHGR